MPYCRNFGREAPELDWEELQRKYMEEEGTHEVIAKVTVHKYFDNCTPAEAVDYMNDYLTDRLSDADDYEADIKEVK